MDFWTKYLELVPLFNIGNMSEWIDISSQALNRGYEFFVQEYSKDGSTKLKSENISCKADYYMSQRKNQKPHDLKLTSKQLKAANCYPQDARQKEKITDYLEGHPSFLKEYIDRNPDLLDDYVHNNVDEMTVREWLKKVEGPPPAEILQAIKIDFLKEINSVKHHTEKYVNNSLVVRRASTIDLEIYFKNRPYNQAKDNVLLEFSIGEKPTLANGTKFRCPVGDVLNSSEFSCKLVKVDEQNKTINVQVNIPANAIVGKYHTTIEVTTRLADGPKTERKTKPDILVLFNPFSPADEVYMEDEAKRNEYVLNDTGIIYYGQSYRIGGMDWLFGQFEPGILSIALELLREAPNAKKNPVKSLKKRSSPIYCSRTLSAMINCNDDEGVLYGRWDGKYEDGKGPTSWIGSVKILKQWHDSGMQPVKYGQCWVFSGVLTTVLRAIGIPARSVTNFQSAHDTEFNMTIDRFVNDEGEESDEKYSGDSVWNFHVWNEGWFRRSDLPKGYDGWQAVDATPQEESGGVFQCGPASVAAIKNGEIFVGFDTNFLFSEVNADRLTWKVDEHGEVTELIRRETRTIGQHISTKAVGSKQREDITHEYKYDEGSEKERIAFERAYAFGEKAPYHDKFNVIKEEGAIVIDIKEVGEAVNGKTVTISVKVKNTTKINKTAIITTAINTMLHNDERKTLIKKAKIELNIRAQTEKEQVFELLFADYGRHLADNNVIRVFTAVRVKETDNFYVDSYDVQVASPDCLTLKCEDQVAYWEDVQVSFKLVNPLPVSLTGGIFTVEGNGVISDEEIHLTEPIPPNATYETKAIKINPYRIGEVELIGEFDSNEIVNIMATKTVTVVRE